MTDQSIVKNISSDNKSTTSLYRARVEEDEGEEYNRKIQANTNAGWENTAQLEGHENEVKNIS